VSEHGGARPGAGRPKGSKDKATIEQRGTLAELARQHTDDALRTLVDVCLNGDSASARVTAATAILDRGYGKPAQMVTTEISGPDGGLVAVEHSTRDIIKALMAWSAEALRSKDE
jgi:hypothetical protein